jgi:CRP/FNR family transcriptional regulator
VSREIAVGFKWNDVKRHAVRARSFKTVVMHRDGREQVTGFHLAGDVLGLDGVCSRRHSCDALAIEDSKVCIIPFHLLEAMCREVKALQQHVHRLMGGETVREATLMMLLGRMSADRRVAAFLMNLSEKLKTRGYSPAEFRLRMTREEIGSYLGMKLETVSRMFSEFQKDGLVDTDGKRAGFFIWKASPAFILAPSLRSRALYLRSGFQLQHSFRTF